MNMSTWDHLPELPKDNKMAKENMTILNKLQKQQAELNTKLSKQIPQGPFNSIFIDPEHYGLSFDGGNYLTPEETVRLTKWLYSFYIEKK